MSLFAVLTVDDTFGVRVKAALPTHHDLAQAVTWAGLRRLVRERPVSAVLLDSACLVQGRDTGDASPPELLAALRRDFPSVGAVCVARRDTQGELLFSLGAAGVSDLKLVRLEELPHRLPKEIRASLRWSAASRVVQALGSRVSRRHLGLIRRTFEVLHKRQSADEFAQTLGTHRPQLSQQLGAAGLPSVGQLLLWGRIFQAAVWLVEPGRTAESVSRQLEYSSGAAFRRVLRNQLGTTPSDLVEAGGLQFALSRFLNVYPVAPAMPAAPALPTAPAPAERRLAEVG